MDSLCVVFLFRFLLIVEPNTSLSFKFVLFDFFLFCSFERQEQRQKVLSYFLVPAGVAFLIFGPDKKKEKLEETIETST